MNPAELKLLKQLMMAFNNLNTKLIESYLADNIIYRSEWAKMLIKGKSQVVEFLNEGFTKVQRINRSRFILLNAVICKIPSLNMKYCILLSMINNDNLIQAILMIKVRRSLNSRIDTYYAPEDEEILIGFNKVYKK